MPIRRAVPPPPPPPPSRESAVKVERLVRQFRDISHLKVYEASPVSHIYFPARHVSQGRKEVLQFLKFSKERAEKGESPVSRSNGRCEFLKSLENGRKVLGYRCAL